MLLQAKALAESGSTDSGSGEAPASRDYPAQGGRCSQPRFRRRIPRARGNPPQAKRQVCMPQPYSEKTLRANPKDAPAASLLIEILAQGKKPGVPPSRVRARRGQASRDRSDFTGRARQHEPGGRRRLPQGSAASGGPAIRRNRRDQAQHAACAHQPRRSSALDRREPARFRRGQSHIRQGRRTIRHGARVPSRTPSRP